ncbi:hypothetical protein SLS60_000158 [Paraconiothyrium brasiliense]|uniref:Uncharacterized protein n=1 Tax=Paraconiothyrium brasiliense TaxID=300254 RepID=A0ABR3S5F5_9PLEO
MCLMNAPTPASVQPVQGEAMAAVRARLRGMVEAAELQNMAADEEHNNQPQPPENPSQARATPGYANLPVAGMNLGIASPVSVDDIDVLRGNVSSDDSDSDSDFVEEIASRASVNAEGEQDDGITMNDQANESWPDALFQGGRRLSSRRHHDGQLSWSEPNNPIVDLMDPGEVNAINTGTREDSVNTLSMERPVLNEDSSLVPNPPNIAGSPDIVDEGDRDGEDALLAHLDQAPRRRHQARRNTQARRDRPRSVFHGRAVNSTEVIRRIRARHERSAASRRLRALDNNVNGATDTSDTDTVDVEAQRNNDPRVVRDSHITPNLAPIPAFAGGFAAAPLYPLTIRPDATAGPERPPWIRQHPPEGIRPSRPRYEPRSQLGMRHRSPISHVDPVPIYAPTPAPVPALPPAPAPARNEISGQGPGYYITELQIQRARSHIMLFYHYVGEFANVETIRSDDDHQVVLQRHPDGLVEVRVRADGHTMIGNHVIFFRFRR